jgi:hypothetical protein
MKDQILAQIGSMKITKEKNANCANKIRMFINELSPELLQKYWEVENLTSDYNIHIQDEIFKRLL